MINGAGASFPYILYSKWLMEYRHLEPSVAINYQSIGSGGGIRQFLKGTLDFGGTDVAVSPQEIKHAKKSILHIPMTLGAVAVTYQLKEVKPNQHLRFDGEILAQIFRGKITNWNHPAIKKLNPNIDFPTKPIAIIYRADGSGTTAFFTDFLSQHSKKFLNDVGKGKSVNWPVGIGGKGNEGVMGLVNKMEGAISYISLSYALSQKLPVASIKNKEGQFTKPNVISIRKAADVSLKGNQTFTNSLIHKKGSGVYPLVGFSYIIISKKMPQQKGQAIVKFLKWSLTSGQKFSKPLFFIPLSYKVVNLALKKLDKVQYE